MMNKNTCKTYLLNTLLFMLLFSLGVITLTGCNNSSPISDTTIETTIDTTVETTIETTIDVIIDTTIDATIETTLTTVTEIASLTATEDSTEALSEIQDPHSYLSLVVGNADELSFEYVSTNPETQTSFLGQFYKLEDISGERFEAIDQNSEIITITELELPDGVYYVDESKQKVYHYQGLAEDMLLYKLMNITSYTPISIMDATEGKYYIYEIPFEQDTTKNYHYELLMTPNGIKNLDIFLDDQYVSNITFMEFLNDKPDINFLKIPEAYTLENFDYGVKDINIPPWW